MAGQPLGVHETGSGLVVARGCGDLEGAFFDSEFAERLVLEGLAGSGAYREGQYSFADDKPGQSPATLKTVAEHLTGHPFWGRLVLSIYEAHPCLDAADVITYVPDGPRDFTTELGDRVRKPVAHARRIPGGGKRDYEWTTPTDMELAATAERLFMVEDITSTGSSPAAMRSLIAGAQVEIGGMSEAEAYEVPVHVLSMLLRAELNPTYLRGLILHVLATQPTPRSAAEFRELYGIEPVKDVRPED